MDTSGSFGYWLRRQRKALDLTQQVLAERVGCSLAAIKKIESDERRPSRQIAERLADVLGVQAAQREAFLETARGVRPADKLLLAHAPAVRSLPTGTVTLLYTDIEGSTRLWAQHPEAMVVSCARHDQIVREAIESNRGYVFQVVGDSFRAAFHTAGDALRAALKAQLDLHAENWGEAPIRVRMGLHTGKAEAQPDGSYRGYVTLSHVQHLMAAGQGGQVLISFAAQELVRDELQGDMELRNLGTYRLKSFDHPEPIFQLVLPGLPGDFPPLDSLDVLPNNLPAQLTSFIGREHELAEVKQLLSATRLLTLTGPGGTGKTRLALQLAADVLQAFDRGVWLVELAPLADPTLVPQTVAAALGVREQPGRTILDALMDYVRTKSMLIVLDNCEHLIDVCAQLADALLRTAPGLKILTSSRESLGIAGETAYRVPSLPLPDPRKLTNLNIVAQNDCVRLFVDRALSAYPPFRLKENNASAIADICRRLDGIPLAIELAAARTKVFPPEQIAARLDDRFKLLTGGSRTALERHQTLFALIDWSHNLLSEPERVLLRRLSVFAGGWSLEAAQAVCGEGLGQDLPDTLAHLADKSLVTVEEPSEAMEGRYRLLETIRQYARDRLLEVGESERVRDRHLDYFLDFAAEAEPKLRTGEQLEWLERLETEHDNVRTALGWSLESDKSGNALDLAGALGYFWNLRGYFSEGQKWLNDGLALAALEPDKKVGPGDLDTRTDGEAARRAKALYFVAWFQLSTLGVKSGRETVEESLRLWRQLGNKWWTAVALELSGLLLSMENYPKALASLEEGVSLARQVEDPWPLAACLIRLGDALKPRGELAAAQRYLEEGVAIARSIGDRNELSEGLRELASIYYAQRNLTTAEQITEEALVEASAIGSIIPIFLAQLQLVIISCLQEDAGKAKRYCAEIWGLIQDTGAALAAVMGLAAFGIAAARFEEKPVRGVRLLAAALTQMAQRGLNFASNTDDPLARVFMQSVETARSRLGPAAFDGAWAEGQRMTLEQALALATEIQN